MCLQWCSGKEDGDTMEKQRDSSLQRMSTINIDENPGAQPGLHSKIVVQNIIDRLITRGSQYLNLILEFKINGNIRQLKNHPRKRHWWNESPTLNKHLHWVGHFDGWVPFWQVVIERSPYQDAQLVVCRLGLYWVWELNTWERIREI